MRMCERYHQSIFLMPERRRRKKYHKYMSLPSDSIDDSKHRITNRLLYSEKLRFFYYPSNATTEQMNGATKIPFQNKMFVLNSQFTSVPRTMIEESKGKRKKDWCFMLFIYIATEPSSSVQLKRIKCDLMFHPAFVWKCTDFPLIHTSVAASLSFFEDFRQIEENDLTLRTKTHIDAFKHVLYMNMNMNIRSNKSVTTPKIDSTPLSIPDSFASWKVKIEQSECKYRTQLESQSRLNRKECGRYRAYAADSLAYTSA